MTVSPTAVAVLVSCVVRENRKNNHEAITALGGLHNGEQWLMSSKDIIAELESPYPRWMFYTSVGGRTAIVRVVHGPNGKYLRTFADGYPNDNLLALPECI